MSTEYKELLGILGEHLGIDDVTPNENGVCSLRLDDRLSMHLEFDHNQAELHIYSVLAAVPDTVEARERLYGVLLEANLFFRGTGGGTLGVDPASAEIILSRTLQISGISHHAFLESLEIHVNVADTWLDRLARLDDEFLLTSASGTGSEPLYQIKA